MLTRKSRSVSAASFPLLMRCGSCYESKRVGAFVLSVTNCLPAVSASSSRSPRPRLGVTAETTTEQSPRHDFAPSPSRAREKVDSFLVRKSRFWSSGAIFFRLRRLKGLRRQALPRAAPVKNFELPCRATVFQETHHFATDFGSRTPRHEHIVTVKKACPERTTEHSTVVHRPLFGGRRFRSGSPSLRPTGRIHLPWPCCAAPMLRARRVSALRRR